MKRTFISAILLGFLSILCGFTTANATEETAQNAFREIGACDMSEFFSWPVSLSTCNDNYGFFTGYIETTENNQKKRIQHLVTVDLESLEVVSNVEMDWKIKSMCATNDYLYVLHVITRQEHEDTTAHLRIFDVSNPQNNSLLDYELTFRINGGILLVEDDNLVLVAESYTLKDVNTKIFHMNISNPAKPEKLSSSFVDVKNVSPVIGDDGKAVRDENGKVVYRSLKDHHHSIIGKAHNARLNGDYLYFILNNDIWSFDLEGRNEEGEKSDPEESRPFYMGRLKEEYSPISSASNKIYNYCWSDTEEEGFFKGADYFFFLGENENAFNITERKIGERTIKTPIRKFGVLVFHSTHQSYMGGHGDTKVTRCHKMSQLELEFTPLSIESNGNWVYVTGYEEIFTEEMERMKRKGILCLLDSYNPKEIKLVDTTSTDWYPYKTMRNGNRLYITDLQSKLHVLEMTLESKGFSKEIYKPMSKADKKRSDSYLRKGLPRYYIYRYQGYDMAYRDKISITKNKMPKTRIMDWKMVGIGKGIIVNIWEYIPYEVRRRYKPFT
ncbi:hypothetical protein J7L05_06770 [bacterium]|nr:hypothetical protein [bacterium]